MSFIADDTVGALRAAGTEALPHYEGALRAACGAAPPPFGHAWYGDTYRQLASTPEWLASSLVANAEKEGEGSRKLWSLVARTPDPAIAEAIRVHAVDESRHALLYLGMCDLVFPGAIDSETRAFTDTLSPRYSMRDAPAPAPPARLEVVIDELVQMNLGEIRTRIHQLLMRPVIAAYCPLERQDRLLRVLDSLLGDETRHIRYTARLIDQAARAGHARLIEEVTRARLREFNEITLAEVGEARFVGE